MMRLWRTSAWVALLLVIGGPFMAARGQVNPPREESSPHLVVSLLAEPKALRPGATLWLGLRFQPAPSWHIYWRNPGDSGEPPRVEWRLPAGVTAGDMQWPTPERLGKSPIVDYGYAGDTILLTRLHVGGNVSAEAKLNVGATVSWVVCSDICIPGKAVLSVPLGATTGEERKLSGNGSGMRAGAPTRVSEKLLADAVRRLPKPLPPTWRATIVDEGNSFELTLVTGKPESRATFFPFVPEQVENAASQKVTALPNGVRLTLAKSDGLLKPISVLRGVIVPGDGSGYEIAAPVKAARSAENEKESTQ